LQRKCACGGEATGATGECDECRAKKVAGLQAKRWINESGDVYEQEADRVAEQVLAQPTFTGVSNAPPRIQRYQGRERKQIDPGSSSVERTLARSGRPLEPSLLHDMEQRFGHDLGRVRVHTDAGAAESAQAVGAHAYTVGSDIVFGRGHYAPGTSAGKRLLAHELTHVVQQLGGSDISPGPSPGKRDLSFGGRQAAGTAGDGGKLTPLRNAAASSMTLQRDATGDLAESIARDLNDYVAKHSSPYDHIIEVFHNLNRRVEEDIDDNVAAAFVELQSDAKLEQFASVEKGRDMLDVLYEAMITGHVTSFESLQAERILIAKGRWIPLEQYMAQAERIARLRHMAEDPPVELAVDMAASKTARKLNDDVAKRRYGDVIRKVRDLSRTDEDDNVASTFVELQSPARLEEFAASKEGRAMLDVLYNAIITGDITDFERLQAERILKAKRQHLDPKQYKEFIFPITDPIFSENAVFVAELKDGKVHLHYQTRGLYRDSRFKEEAKTLPDDLNSRDLILDPDDVVRVKLYDEGEVTATILAIQLIDFANQGNRRFLNRVEKTVELALTLPASAASLGGASVKALAAAVEAGEASRVTLAIESLLLWADRAAFVVQLTSLVANANRDWILKKFPRYGGAFLAALDQVDGFVGMYGLGRMGLDGFRFIRHKISPALENWRKEAATRQLPPSEQATVKGIEDQLDNFMDGLAPGEAVASINERPREHPIEGNKPGERRAPVKDGHNVVHEVVEVRDAAGIHCEYRSPGNLVVDCPHVMGESAPAKVEPAPTQKADEPPAKEKARPPAAAPRPDEPVKEPSPAGVETAHVPPASAPIDPKVVEQLTQRRAQNEKRIAEIDRQHQIHEERRRDYIDKSERRLREGGPNAGEDAAKARRQATNEARLRDQNDAERQRLASENKRIATELNPHKSPKPGPPPGKPHGGAHKDMEAWGGERNHIPADDATKIPRDRGPAIWMERNDHLQLNSTGNRRFKPTTKYLITSAEEWRAVQRDLCRRGKVMDAVQMDIDDIQSKFGHKYDQGIQEMLDYIRTLKAREF
jgi:hypothetical protein